MASLYLNQAVIIVEGLTLECSFQLPSASKTRLAGDQATPGDPGDHLGRPGQGLLHPASYLDVVAGGP